MTRDRTRNRRQRRFRERQRTGSLPTLVDVPPQVVERLIELGKLSPTASEDTKSRGEALSKLLGDWARAFAV